ncbi:MAG: hypothetical protein EP346_13685 [Bacteroidetes bacterium]|nr:MAG: hypothetical protein EP346_13685 [Bacteroidota bacterium]
MEFMLTPQGDFPDSLIDSLAREAEVLSNLSADQLEKLIEAKSNNPEAQSIVSNSAVSEAISQSSFIAEAVPTSWSWIKWLREQVRKVFCEMSEEIRNKSWKELIKEILKKLAEKIGSLSQFVIALVVAILTLLVKLGANAVCPL